jgi:hypothetical protein
MIYFEKIAQFLNSFEAADENYDYANYILQKLSEIGEKEDRPDFSPDQNIEEQEQLRGSDKSKNNLEGNIMAGAFKELEEPIEAVEKANYMRAFLEKLKS